MRLVHLVQMLGTPSRPCMASHGWTLVTQFISETNVGSMKRLSFLYKLLFFSYFAPCFSRYRNDACLQDHTRLLLKKMQNDQKVAIVFAIS